MQQYNNKGKTQEITGIAAVFGVSHRVLADAVPPVTLDTAAQEASSFGWITGACVSPAKEDRYLVEFINKREFRIFAYADRFGRVFSTAEPIVAPPAREPDLSFARFVKQAEGDEDYGCIEVLSSEEGRRQVAQYACVNGRYRFFDTWFNFGPHAVDLSYDDAMARAYFALVHRPLVGGAQVPTRGMELVHACLLNEKPLAGLRALVAAVSQASEDAFVNPPALACSLVRWLNDAGLNGAAFQEVPDDALRLVRTVRYANTYFLALEDEKTSLTYRDVWALESVLNRFLLVEEVFEGRGYLATEADCSRWDTYLLETIGTRLPATEQAPAQPVGLGSGEWEVRCRLGAVLERLRLPVRVEARMDLAITEGAAAFELIVPDADLMPTWNWQEGEGGFDGSLVKATEFDRDLQARRYSMHVGLMIAAATFEISPAIQQVYVVARPLALRDDADSSSAAKDEAAQDALPQGEFPVNEGRAAYYSVVLTRENYAACEGFHVAQASDPVALMHYCGARFDVLDADPFVSSGVQAVAKLRYQAPEAIDARLPEATHPVLGAAFNADLRIASDSYRRRIGEQLADRIVHAETATQAIRIVREEQDAAETRDDDKTSVACTHLMAALAEGSLDTKDQNAVVGCFLGEDRCLIALGRAQALVQKDPAAAVEVLMDAIAEAAALDGFVDGATTVHRSFESYAARVLYNRALRRAEAHDSSTAEVVSESARDVPTLDARALADVGKRVVLVSDSFYLCHLEIVRLLERSFDRTEDALRYGVRAIEIAPATAAGYRQLGRAYMLVGDMEHASAVLRAGLCVATQPTDLSIAYYQLAYTLWKTGQLHAGAACYLKSLMLSPAVALQAMAELRELVSEHGIEPLAKEDLDEGLTQLGVVVAPTPEVFEVLDSGAAAATDAELPSVAKSLLALRLTHRADDALVNVLRSLED